MDKKSVFCKVSVDTKEKFDEMCSFYQISMAELLETLVTDQYTIYINDRNNRLLKLADQFVEE